MVKGVRCNCMYYGKENRSSWNDLGRAEIPAKHITSVFFTSAYFDQLLLLNLEVIVYKSSFTLD